MKIAVCVKQVPDSWAEKKMSGGVLDRASVDAVLNDLDEYDVVEEEIEIEKVNFKNLKEFRRKMMEKFAEYEKLEQMN